ncbi:Glycosyltransferase involved in cell wall bisynthesis [Lachnospiraceae bacterium KH1T2]|nr:Glycosyltransferase involved in cell wall bisynthesis [Lachnospiraceae bacterium KH1T2]
MNILILNMFYFPNMVGGTENSVKLLAEGLVKDGNQVAVYTNDSLTNTKDLEECFVNGVYVYRDYFHPIAKKILGKKSNIFDKVVGKLASINNVSSNKKLKNLIKDFKPNVIHTNNIMSMSFWVWRYGVKNGIKVVHTLRDYWLIDAKYTLNSSTFLIASVHRIIFRILTNIPEVVITAPSNCTLEIFRKYSFFENNKLFRVENCVDLNKYYNYKLIKEKMNLNTNSIKFIYVGRLGRYKGIDLLIKAFKEVKNPDIRLIICGSGPLELFVKNETIVDNRIIYLGQLSMEDLYEQYKIADVLVVPSVWDEPFGRIVIEGAMFGLVSIVSSNGGLKEIVMNLKNGEVYDIDTSDSIKNKIYKFMDRKVIKTYISNIDNNMEYYSLKAQIKKFKEIYEEL